MSNGLKAWENGSLVQDVTERITRSGLQVSISPGSTGSVTCPEGTPWMVLYLLDQNEPGTVGGAPAPQITVSGSTISWGPKSGVSTSQAATLVYGAW